MAIFGSVLFKKSVWELADEVYDNGDELVFIKGGNEQHVKLRDIINIGHTQFSSPVRIVVHVRSDGPIGNELAFNPSIRFNLFKKSSLVRDLIERVDRARSI